MTSACLGIGCFHHWNVPDSPVSAVLGAYITEKGVSFLTVLAEGPRADFDQYRASLSHDSFHNLRRVT